jgi:hypothetical protein
MHNFYINIFIILSSTCFEHPSVHPQEDLRIQFYGISFMHPYKQAGQWQDVLVCVRVYILLVLITQPNCAVVLFICVFQKLCALHWPI